MAQRLKTIIVEDQKIGIDLVKHCLSERFELVECCQSAADAWRAFERHRPQVAVVDIELPDGSGLDLASRMLEKSPELRILGVSAKTDEYTLYRVLMGGFCGFVDKNTESIDTLRHALEVLASGGCYFAPSIHRNLIEQNRDPNSFAKVLSSKEQELLRYFGSGLSNERVAEMTGLRPITVQNHKAKMMRKLGLHSSVDLIRYAFQKGFVIPADFANKD